MTKEEYGELLKYLGILKYAIHKLRDKENELELEENILQAIKTITDEVPMLDTYI